MHHQIKLFTFNMQVFLRHTFFYMTTYIYCDIYFFYILHFLYDTHISIANKSLIIVKIRGYFDESN